MNKHEAAKKAEEMPRITHTRQESKLTEKENGQKNEMNKIVHWKLISDRDESRSRPATKKKTRGKK